MMIVRKLDVINDDLKEIASLLYYSKVHKIPYRLVSINEAESEIPKAMQLTGTEYDADNFWLCFEDGKLAGAIQCYSPSKIDPGKAVKIYTSVIGRDRKFARDYKQWREFSKPRKNVNNTLYIHNAVFVEGHDVPKVFDAIFKEMLRSIDTAKYLSIHTDIISKNRTKIEFLKPDLDNCI